eukprot:TRINITY_DN18516_c0_g1_i1.p1 TRINITY_DN18516_c0_g1~~TRINITY_DN18516_c0_g1_i1.p1  ORF type:complete len:458 (+),score=67.23 TRINITY_DN18516_c0_g1_i1:357-1730(+)
MLALRHCPFPCTPISAPQCRHDSPRILKATLHTPAMWQASNGLFQGFSSQGVSDHFHWMLLTSSTHSTTWSISARVLLLELRNWTGRVLPANHATTGRRILRRPKVRRRLPRTHLPPRSEARDHGEELESARRAFIVEEGRGLREPSGGLLGMLFSRVLSSVLSSQLDKYGTLKVRVGGRSLDLLWGNLDRVLITAERASYKGLLISRADLSASGLRLSGGGAGKGEGDGISSLLPPEKRHFPARLCVILTEEDLNSSLSSPLVISAIRDVLSLPRKQHPTLPAFRAHLREGAIELVPSEAPLLPSSDLYSAQAQSPLPIAVTLSVRDNGRELQMVPKKISSKRQIWDSEGEIGARRREGGGRGGGQGGGGVEGETGGVWEEKNRRIGGSSVREMGEGFLKEAWKWAEATAGGGYLGQQGAAGLAAKTFDLGRGTRISQLEITPRGILLMGHFEISL